MTDIVERLRVTADDTDAVENSSVARLLEDAAAEIERLRLSIIGDYPGEDNPAREDNDAAVNSPPNQRNGCGESERKSAR